MAGIKVSAAQEAIEGKKSRHLVRAAALSHAGYSPGCHRNLSLFILAASLPPFLEEKQSSPPRFCSERARFCGETGLRQPSAGVTPCCFYCMHDSCCQLEPSVHVWLPLRPLSPVLCTIQPFFLFFPPPPRLLLNQRLFLL